MGISIELIDEMRKRTNCSYQEAKELLEKNNGDLLEAIVEFEKRHGHGFRHDNGENNNRNYGFGDRLSRLIKKGFKTRLIVEKGKETVLNISINVLIIIALIALPAFWLLPAAVIVGYFMGYKFRIRREQGKDIDINKAMDQVGDRIKTETGSKTDKSSCKNQGGDDNDDDYNEITVE